jgi:cardiolipin synthase (CMP-forming)
MKEKIWNIPNILTVLRILLVPFFIYYLFQPGLYAKLIAFSIFIVASLTDLIDGYLARKWKQETEFGKFLDPLADKVLVLGSFITFLLLNEQIEVWMLLLIVLRDMLITTLRYVAVKQGSSIRTTYMGKVKTTFQMGAIIVFLVFFMVVKTGKSKEINAIYANGKLSGKTGLEIAYTNYKKFTGGEVIDYDIQSGRLIEGLATFLPYYVMLLTTMITVFSGARYLYSNRELLSIRSAKILVGIHHGNKKTHS